MKVAIRGAALLEVMVALVILATAGLTAVIGVSEAAHTMERARQRESRFRAANSFLNTAVLWPREDLDRRLGERRQGPWLMYIERRGRSLYYMSLADTVTGTLLLWTQVFRPEVMGEER